VSYLRGRAGNGDDLLSQVSYAAVVVRSDVVHSATRLSASAGQKECLYDIMDKRERSSLISAPGDDKRFLRPSTCDEVRDDVSIPSRKLPWAKHVE
jgi:hypothetical protein